MKPSERIAKLAKENCMEGIDSGFSDNNPSLPDYVSAIVQYLDEQQKGK